MSNFEFDLLNKLLDKYESSKLSKGGTKINKKIILTTKDSVLRTYTLINSYQYVENNDAIISKLEKLGFINAKYEYDTFKSLTLNLDMVDDIYHYLNRDKPSDELNKIKDILSKYHFNNYIDDFINYIYSFIEDKYDYPKSYFQDSSQLDLILKTFKYLFSLECELKKRVFSAKYLCDSKKFESIEGKIIKIVKDFSCVDYASNQDVLVSLGIIENSTYALIKNNLVFKLNEVIIDLNALKFEYLLSDEMIDNLVILPSLINKVITVENLTSFYNLDDKEAIIVYLGGFHNHTKQKLLVKLHESYPKALYYHFGDIDVGGFYILMNLREKTKIDFIPYRMNIDELKRHANNLKPLTSNDIKRLNELLLKPEFEVFKETILFMLNHNVKLEQELLDD